MGSEGTSQDLCRPSFAFSPIFSSQFSLSLLRSPLCSPNLQMYASPSPFKHSQDYQKLSPALAATPHLFTPPVPFKKSSTPGLSPIDHSPRPLRPARTLARASPRRPFLEKLLRSQDDSDEDGFAFDDKSSPPSSSVHLGCTSTPPRATPNPSSSPFSSPLSASSSLDIPLSFTPASPHRPDPIPSRKETSRTIPSLTVSLKRPASRKRTTRRKHKRLKVTTPESSPSLTGLPSQRTFPPSVPINSEFPGFYLRFPVIPPVLKAYVLQSFFSSCVLTTFKPLWLYL
jgi:hypothetical protein